MKSVLLSIKPKYCELIASGKKTVELRKTKPKIDTPFKCYIYCTNTKPYLVWGDVFRGDWQTEFTSISGYNRKDAEEIWDVFNGKVIGEFVCDKITMSHVGYNTDGLPSYWNILDGSCLTPNELVCYGEWKALYGWHISDLKIYDNPKELSELRHCCNPSSDDGSCYGCRYNIGLSFETGATICENVLYRPPQSWCYVEEVQG